MSHKLLHFVNNDTGDEYIVLDTGDLYTPEEWCNPGFMLDREFDILEISSIGEWASSLPTNSELRKERMQ